jgi:transcriptional regulator with AAA-type ATPase domain
MGTRGPVRAAYPAALLVDHPALPVPIPYKRRLRFECGTPVSINKLSRRDRLRLVAQLTSLAALLAEHDLWPGQSAMRRAVAIDTGHGLQAVVRGLPVSLSQVSRRLGGGEEAALRVRDAVIVAACSAAGISARGLRQRTSEPGFFLEPWLHKVLSELPRPLDQATAASLWAVHWDLPPLPDAGEVVYWSVPREATALRLGSAIWASAQRRQLPSWFGWVTGDDQETAPLPALGARGTLVLAGSPGQSDLAAAERWVQRDGCSAVVLGRFPRGWDPPWPPVLDATRLTRHLTLTGASLDRCRREVERRCGRFHPLSSADCKALTRAATFLFDEPRGEIERLQQRDQADQVARVLSLCPEGLPESFVVLHSGLPPVALQRRLGQLGAVAGSRGWRLPEQELLRCDPLHQEVAGLFAADDPRHLRHTALAGGSSCALLQWARSQLDQLHNDQVRAVLSEIAPGELGPEVQLALAEASLAELDLAGAREALTGLPEDVSKPWQQWLAAVDSAPGSMPNLLSDECATTAPRAGAEVALVVMERALRYGDGDLQAARAALDNCNGRLQGAAQRWYRIEAAAIDRPELLADRSWRLAAVDGHPRLWQLMLRRRAMVLGRNGESNRARRLLSRVAASESRPGYKGQVQLELTTMASEAGDSGSADQYALNAFRLLKVAGFRQRTRHVLLSLAINDLDQLRVDRAERRLAQAADDQTDPMLQLDLARLALARGDEQELRRLLSRLDQVELPGDPRTARTFILLTGATALLDGNLTQAQQQLAAGGLEARAWLTLVNALARQPFTAERADGWGVTLAAELTERAARLPADEVANVISSGALEPREGLALALVERLNGPQEWLDPGLRRTATEVLQSSGLSGWSRQLQQQSRASEASLAAMAVLVEGGGPYSLATDQAGNLLDLVGLAGLEVRSANEGQLLWQCGTGDPGTAVHRGRLILIPLGGEPTSEAAWRLLIATLELLMPGTEPALTGDGFDETGYCGVSPAARQVQSELRLLGPSQMAVALFGETGTGKEVAARALHRLSGRKGQLIPVNVAAIPGTLLEAELFGSVKGAFSGADRARRGLVTAADQGTLFLDEIGDLDLPLQAKLLRFLESQEVRPVGSDQTHQVNVRILTATHRDLEARIQDGSFRKDLFYRIATAQIRIPALRDRRDDIPLLRSIFCHEIARRNGQSQPHWSHEADQVLLRYHWPGNVRELKHAVELAMVRAGGATVHSAHLPLTTTSELPRGTWDEAVQEFRRRFLSEALRRNQGNRSATARELGISRQTLLYHIRSLGLQET